MPPSQIGGMFAVDGLPSTGPYGASHGAPNPAMRTTTRNSADSRPGLSARSSPNRPGRRGAELVRAALDRLLGGEGVVDVVDVGGVLVGGRHRECHFHSHVSFTRGSMSLYTTSMAMLTATTITATTNTIVWIR